MVIQTELFEDKDTQILLRCKESFKNEVKALAKDNQLNLSSYIKYLLTQELKKAKIKGLRAVHLGISQHSL